MKPLVHEKKCTKCGELKSISEFNKNKNRKDGHESQCRECRKEQKRKYRNSEHGRNKNKEYYWKNVERERARLRKRNGTKEYIEYQRMYREKNREKVMAYKKKWDKENQIWYKLKNHIYFSKEKGLKIDWDEKNYYEVMELFGNKCCLSKETENINMDHFVAIATGHCGTYKGNMVPLSSSLNSSKSNKNPFEWIKEQPKEYQKEFVNVVEILAKQNGLSLNEFRDFVYWCYENPRDSEEIKEEKIDSLELWKKEYKIAL